MSELRPRSPGALRLPSAASRGLYHRADSDMLTTGGLIASMVAGLGLGLSLYVALVELLDVAGGLELYSSVNDGWRRSDRRLLAAPLGAALALGLLWPRPTAARPVLRARGGVALMVAGGVGLVLALIEQHVVGSLAEGDRLGLVFDVVFHGYGPVLVWLGWRLVVRGRRAPIG